MAKLVRDFMTNGVVTVSEDAPVADASLLLAEHSFRHLPVVTADGNICGIISDRDLILPADVKACDLTVSDLMAKTTFVVRAGDSLAEAGQVLKKNRIGALPVVNDLLMGQVIGILSYLDILRAHRPLTAQRVGQFMSPRPLTLSPEEEISRAFELSKASSFRHFPVVNQTGKVVGILSDRNLRMIDKILLGGHERKEEIVHKVKVRDIMKSDVVTAFPDTSIVKAAAILLQMRMGALPVVEKARLVGILSYVDILDAFAESEGLLAANTP